MKVFSKMRLLLSLIPTGLCTLASATSCGINISGSNLPAPCDSVAVFDYFEYEGHDALYDKYPLTNNSDFYSNILPGSYPDPSICTNGKGDYYLVNSSFVYYPGVPIFHSRDLVNWHQIGNVLDRPSQLVNLEGQHVSGGIFAPDIAYNPANNTYYMVTTNVGVGNFFVKTTDPAGKWSDPILLPEVQGIDPSFFFDDDGSAYILNSDNAPENKPEYDGHRTVRIQRFDVENDCTSGDRIIIANKGTHPETNPIWMEGPHMYKINGKYFLMTAEGGTGGWHSEVIFRGDSPTGPFEAWDRNPILTQRHLDSNRPDPVTCAGHADLVQTDDSHWWAVCLGSRPDKNGVENLGRETFLLPVKWSDDGFPYITSGDEVLPTVVTREGVIRSDSVTFGNFVRHDDFDSPKRGLEWMTLRGPADEACSLTSMPGYLALRCLDRSARDKVIPAYMCRRLQHHDFCCSTRMFFNPQSDGQRAGLLLFKDETHQYFMGMERAGEDGRRLTLLKVKPEGVDLIASRKIDSDVTDVRLRIESADSKLRFCFSEDGNDKWDTLADKIDAAHLSMGEAGGFTGVCVGLYATSHKDI